MKEPTLLKEIKKTLMEGGEVFVRTPVNLTRYAKPDHANFFTADHCGDIFVQEPGEMRMLISYCDIRCVHKA